MVIYNYIVIYIHLKHYETLQIPNGKSEVVIRRTDNTMANRKGTKRQTSVNKILHRKLKIKEQNLTNTSVNSGAP